MSTLELLTKCLNGNKTLSVSVYKPENKNLWDGFVSSAKNGVFLFF